MKKQLLSVVILLVMLLTCIPDALAATSSKQKEEGYAAAVKQLEEYLETRDHEPNELEMILAQFESLERYEQSNFFKYYVTVLIRVENDEFGMATDRYLKLLDNEVFNKLLESDFKDSSIRPVKELKAYVLGRECEYKGDKEKACEYYMECPSFYDASERCLELEDSWAEKTYKEAVALFDDGKLAEAYALFATIKRYNDCEFFMDYIEEELGGVPSAETTPAPTALEIVTQPLSVTAAKENDKVSTTVEAVGDGLTYQWYIKEADGRKFSKSSITDATYEVTMTAAKNGRQAYCVITDQYGNTAQTDTVTLYLAAPVHEHTWIPADCTHPIMCSTCGATDGKALGHIWQDATCTNPKTCTRCGATDGTALGHNWQDAMCTEPMICLRCGATNGNALGHDWLPATKSSPKTCSRCGATEGSHEHTWTPADCTHPATCAVCGETEGKALGHYWQDATCTQPKTCKRCGATDGKALGHYWQDATCTTPKTCTRCGATDGKALGHKWQDATCTTPKTCTRCGATSGKALGHNWQDATCTQAKTCTRCGATDGKALGHNWQPATEYAPKTCSRCGATKGSKLTWTDWSEWSTTPVSASTTREVQTEVREETTYKTVYQYSRYQYIGKNGNHWYAAYDYSGSSNYVRGGNWQYTTSDTPLAKDSMVAHANGKSYQMYTGRWFNETVTSQPDQTNSVTYYRYRDLK